MLDVRYEKQGLDQRQKTDQRRSREKKDLLGLGSFVSKRLSSLDGSDSAIRHDERLKGQRPERVRKHLSDPVLEEGWLGYSDGDS